MFFRNFLMLGSICLLTRTCSTPLPEESRNELREINDQSNKSIMYEDTNGMTNHLASNFYDVEEGQITYFTREAYLENLTGEFRKRDYISCRDVRKPIIQVSTEGIFAYVISEKELKFLSEGKGLNKKKDTTTTIVTGLQVWQLLGGKWRMVAISQNSLNSFCLKK